MRKEIISEIKNVEKSLLGKSPDTIYNEIVLNNLFSVSIINDLYVGSLNYLERDPYVITFKESLYNLLSELNNEQIISVLYNNVYLPKPQSELYLHEKSYWRDFKHWIFNNCFMSRKFHLSDFSESVFLKLITTENFMYIDYDNDCFYKKFIKENVDKYWTRNHTINFCIINNMSNCITDISETLNSFDIPIYYTTYLRMGGTRNYTDFMYKIKPTYLQNEYYDLNLDNHDLLLEDDIAFLNENTYIKNYLDRQIIDIEDNENSSYVAKLSTPRKHNYTYLLTTNVVSVFKGFENKVFSFYTKQDILDNAIARELKKTKNTTQFNELEMKFMENKDLNTTDFIKKKTLLKLLDKTNEIPRQSISRLAYSEDIILKLVKKEYNIHDILFILNEMLDRTSMDLQEFDYLHNIISQDNYNIFFISNISQLNVPKITFGNVNNYIYLQEDMLVSEDYALENGLLKLEY